MLKNIEQIYKDYQIPQNLQQHMIFTASLGKIICQNWSGKKIDQDLVVTSLLLHDMGNIVKFNLQPDAPNFFIDQNKIDYWRKIQQEFRKKYGLRADEANLKIIDEIRPYPKIREVMEEHYFEFLPKLLKRKNDWESKIVFYCDLRFNPRGICSIEDRVEDLRNRYVGRDDTWADQAIYQSRMENCLQLETQLDQQTSIQLRKISQSKIDQLVEKLYVTKIKVGLY